MSVIEKLRWNSLEKAIPLQATLELTHRCNERCTHCYIDEFFDDPKKALNKDQWFLVLDKLRAAGTLYLILMGGEAMLSPHFWDILEYAHNSNFHVSMITNGLLVKNIEIAKRLKDKGLRVATLSLYSLYPEIHDEMTAKKGSHVRTMSAIEFLINAGIEVQINCLLTKHNIEKYFDLADWCLKRNLVIKEDVSVTAKLNGNTIPTKLRATAEQLMCFYTERARRWPNSLPQPSKEIEDDYVCSIAKGKCAVTPNGDLLGCIEVRESLGNIAHEDFSAIWNSPKSLKWRNLKVRDVKHSGDKSCQAFCDHCFGMAIHEVHDPLQVTDDEFGLAKIKKTVYEKSHAGKNEL